MTTTDPTRLRAAYLVGDTVASRLRTGNRFRGAMVDGRALGYASDELSQFIAGYHDALKRRWPNGVVLDRDGCLCDPLGPATEPSAAQLAELEKAKAETLAAWQAKQIRH